MILQQFMHRSADPEARRNSFGWNARLVTAPVCCLYSFNILPAERSHSCKCAWKQDLTCNNWQVIIRHTLMVPSSDPLTSNRPSGLKRRQFTASVWPLYVWILLFRWTSQIYCRNALNASNQMIVKWVQTLILVSSDPDAINFPNGWNSRHLILEVWPDSDRATNITCEDHMR